MNSKYVLLTEKEEMWARMLTEVLADNDIPCAALPTYGAGLSIKAGKKERLKIYVPAEHLTRAEGLLDELFSADHIIEEE